MKAYLIDPWDQTVTEVKHTGNYKHIYELISHEEMPVDCFTACYLDDGDAIFVDDEGLFKGEVPFFKIGVQHLAGRGLVLGSDDEGETVEPKIGIEKLRGMISWQVARGMHLYMRAA